MVYSMKPDVTGVIAMDGKQNNIHSWSMGTSCSGKLEIKIQVAYISCTGDSEEVKE